ncbi:MAG: phosphate propanoyltransferase [Endomicrobia bacterium]|nr:phosphate propanoyltransferase [Endomicrobiia bacterium]MCL2798703.1 phosphate propanoyltransferase [Endomicrobiia bacterium]
MEKKRVTVNVSNRHIHLSREHVDVLFGKDYVLTKQKTLMQPHQFAANETLTVIGPRSEIDGVRIVAPERNQTQIEMTVSDARRLGIPVPLRLSGDLKGSAPAVLKGPKGTVELKEGAIVAKRHIHLSETDASEMNLKTGDIVSIKISGERALTYDNAVIRVDEKNAEAECHLDIEEANAALIKNGDKADIII